VTVPGLSITLPTFNEEGAIEQVVEQALAAAEALTDDYELVIVDDGSTDLTGEIAEALATRHEPVRVVHHAVNRGFSGAMQSCVESAHKDLVFLAAADGQADFGDLRRFLSAIGAADLVFSRRSTGAGDWRRRSASFLWYSLLRLAFGMRVPEFAPTFLFRRRVVEELAVSVRADASNFLPVLFVSAKRRGYRVVVVDAAQPARASGNPKGLTIANVRHTLAEDLRLGWRLRLRGRGLG
jgi:glycosyltransferase involved in cell wall biosynthesis